MSACLYLDTSAVLRAVLESGTSPEVEDLIAAAPALITSRLSLVESSRALHRLRQLGQVSEAKLADAPGAIGAFAGPAFDANDIAGHLAAFAIGRRKS